MINKIFTGLCEKLVPRKWAAISFALSVLMIGPRGPVIAATTPASSLTAFMRQHLRVPGLSPDYSARLFVTSVPLADPGDSEILVLVRGPKSCGSGGCTLYVLRPQRRTYRAISEISPVQLPVRVHQGSHLGHPDIGVEVCPGGLAGCYQVVLPFNGTSYDDPWGKHARRVAQGAGKVVIASTAPGTPLY